MVREGVDKTEGCKKREVEYALFELLELSCGRRRACFLIRCNASCNLDRVLSEEVFRSRHLDYSEDWLFC